MKGLMIAGLSQLPVVENIVNRQFLMKTSEVTLFRDNVDIFIITKLRESDVVLDSKANYAKFITDKCSIFVNEEIGKRQLFVNPKTDGEVHVLIAEWTDPFVVSLRKMN